MTILISRFYDGLLHGHFAGEKELNDVKGPLKDLKHDQSFFSDKIFVFVLSYHRHPRNKYLISKEAKL
jgi:hypothetical protein